MNQEIFWQWIALGELFVIAVMGMALIFYKSYYDQKQANKKMIEKIRASKTPAVWTEESFRQSVGQQQGKV
jgi:1,4-dihydroxy-2-naphthoate octaprenyltransferase